MGNSADTASFQFALEDSIRCFFICWGVMRLGWRERLQGGRGLERETWRVRQLDKEENVDC